MNKLVLASLLGVSLGLVASACGSAACQKSEDCPSPMVCLPSHMCAVSCQADSQCPSGQRCASGGCVPTGDCASAADCRLGQTCEQGVCVGNSCGGEKFEGKPVQANMLIVLDHSGSMMEKISGVPKWTSAVDAVRTISAGHPEIRFGLQMFSYSGAQCNAGTVLVPITDNSAQAISSALPANADGAMTPIGGALKVASNEQGLYDPDRANYVLLITDGKENCNGNPVGEVDALFTRGIRTWTVGFGGAVDANRLNQMAIKGGTARQDARRYYQADNQAELAQALAAIARASTGCDFALTQVPPDVNKLFVGINGQLVPRDTGHLSGWDHNQATNRITLYGPACDAVAQANGTATVDIVFGCPGDLTEEGRDGGNIDFSLDGGDIEFR